MVPGPMRKRVRHYGITTIPSPVSVPCPDCRRVMRLRVSPIPFDDIYSTTFTASSADSGSLLSCHRLWASPLPTPLPPSSPTLQIPISPRPRHDHPSQPSTRTCATQGSPAAASAWVSRSISIRCSRPRSFTQSISRNTV